MSSGSVLQLLVSETDPDKLLNCLIMNKLIFLDHRQDKQDTLKEMLKVSAGHVRSSTADLICTRFCKKKKLNNNQYHSKSRGWSWEGHWKVR